MFNRLKLNICLLFYLLYVFFRVFVPSPTFGEMFRCTDKRCAVIYVNGKDFLFFNIVGCCQFMYVFKIKIRLTRHML